ncbi:MAG: hypothetical protein WBE26_09720 [Phycisphaerae bacterium]
MRRSRSSVIGLYLRFLALAFGVSVGVVLLGYLPTVRLGGTEALPGMLMGCGISLLASMIGAIPVVAAWRGPATKMPLAILMSTAVRFLVVLLLALSVALSGWFDRTPLLIWVALSYLLLLVADTLYAVRLSASDRKSEK